jgi:hypothetical protein
LEGALEQIAIDVNPVGVIVDLLLKLQLTLGDAELFNQIEIPPKELWI